MIEEMRERATRAASLDNTSVNITRLRQLAEIGFRQRFPAMPGSGEAN